MSFEPGSKPQQDLPLDDAAAEQVVAGQNMRMWVKHARHAVPKSLHGMFGRAAAEAHSRPDDRRPG